MNGYSFKKKAAAVVIHQMFLILTLCGLFAMDYYMVHDIWNYTIIYCIVAIVGLFGTFAALAYLTSITKKLQKTDKIPSDILAIGCVFIVWGMVYLGLSFRYEAFSFAGLLVAVGTLAYLFDLAFLFCYLSFVRRIKGKILLSQSLLYKLFHFLYRLIKKEPDAPYVLPTRKNIERMQIQRALDAIAEGALDTKLDVNDFHGQERQMAESVNRISIGLQEAVTKNTKNERMKADLITNVSHDIKTPLTSIVNYVDLLKREKLENSNIRNYVRIIDEKSQRLKQLSEDLVEASKISSGNVSLDMQKIDFVELIYQTGGEYNERFEERKLTVVTKLPKEPIYIIADGRQLHRAIENLYTNAAKYALEETRIYVEINLHEEEAIFTMKNISKTSISSEYQGDLTERFVRGEVSRTTEGSGLGLSIAKNLTTLMGGKFEIKAEGDLFIATLSFKMAIL